MWRSLAFVLVVSHCCVALAETHVLTDTKANYNPAEVTLEGEADVDGQRVAWSVRKERLFGGKQQGVDVVTIDNGVLEIVVVPTRGMGIWSVSLRGERICGWDSPVGEIVHPAFVNLTSRGGLGWLDGFGEWLCRCGLESNGQAGQDVIIDNTGARKTIDLTLHGRQANLPAQKVELIEQAEGPYDLCLRGIVHERMMHGPKLELVSELYIAVGASSFRLADEVMNNSSQPTEFQLLYHFNFGAPLLGSGARMHAALSEVWPMNDRAAEALDDDPASIFTFGPPSPGFVEQVYMLWPRSAGDATRVLLENAKGNRGVSLAYSTADNALPYLTLWTNTAAAEDGYVIGIEPGTNFPNTRRHERAKGRVPKLAGGEQRRFSIDVAIHDGSDEVAAVRRGIAEMTGGEPPEFHLQPEPAED